jgi:hypothetical protein
LLRFPKSVMILPILPCRFLVVGPSMLPRKPESVVKTLCAPRNKHEFAARFFKWDLVQFEWPTGRADPYDPDSAFVDDDSYLATLVAAAERVSNGEDPWGGRVPQPSDSHLILLEHYAPLDFVAAVGAYQALGADQLEWLPPNVWPMILHMAAPLPDADISGRLRGVYSGPGTGFCPGLRLVHPPSDDGESAEVPSFCGFGVRPPKFDFSYTPPVSFSGNATSGSAQLPPAIAGVVPPQTNNAASGGGGGGRFTFSPPHGGAPITFSFAPAPAQGMPVAPAPASPPVPVVPTFHFVDSKKTEPGTDTAAEVLAFARNAIPAGTKHKLAALLLRTGIRRLQLAAMDLLERLHGVQCVHVRARTCVVQLPWQSYLAFAHLVAYQLHPRFDGDELQARLIQLLAHGTATVGADVSPLADSPGWNDDRRRHRYLLCSTALVTVPGLAVNLVRLLKTRDPKSADYAENTTSTLRALLGYYGLRGIEKSARDFGDSLRLFTTIQCDGRAAEWARCMNRLGLFELIIERLKPSGISGLSESIPAMHAMYFCLQVAVASDQLALETSVRAMIVTAKTTVAEVVGSVDLSGYGVLPMRSVDFAEWFLFAFGQVASGRGTLEQLATSSEFIGAVECAATARPAHGESLNLQRDGWCRMLAYVVQVADASGLDSSTLRAAGKRVLESFGGSRDVNARTELHAHLAQSLNEARAPDM